MSKIENGEEVIRQVSESGESRRVLLPADGRLEESRSGCTVRLERNRRLTGCILSLSYFVQFFGRAF